MKTNEFYFLLLVCAAFASLAVCRAINTWRYRRWLTQAAPSPASGQPATAWHASGLARRATADAFAQ